MTGPTTNRPTPSGPTSVGQAREALHEVVPRLVDLIRSIHDPDVPAIGSWTIAEVTAHVSHAVTFDRDALVGEPLPEATVTGAGMTTLNERLLRDDPVRDTRLLAERIDALAGEFDTAVASSDDRPVTWLGGISMAPSAVACHLLEECLMHGHDIAAAVGRRWPIERRHAVLAVEGGVFPIISALPPTAFVDPNKAGALRTTVELRIRGGGRTFMCLEDGELRLRSAAVGPVDAHLSADPTALMLTFLGRQGIARAISQGRLAAWGRRPWWLPRLLAATNPP